MPAMTRRTAQRLAVSGLVALTVAAGMSTLYSLGFFSTLQRQSTDFLYPAQPDEPAKAAVIVGIDQRSVRELLPRYGQMTVWPRTVYAQTLDALREADARVVAFDMFFDAPKPEDPGMIAAIARHGNVIMPVEAQGPRRLHPRPGVAQEFDAFFRPTRRIAAAAAAEGFVNVTTDPDTAVRSLPLLLQAGEEQVPALALAAVARYIRRPAVVDEPSTGAFVFSAGRAIPLADNGSMVIHFLGPPSTPEGGGAFTIIPLVDVLTGSFDRTLVKDKIVLIGMTYSGVDIDSYATPTTTKTKMWGVEILGSAIETILSQRYLTPASPRVTIGLIVSLTLFTTFLVAYARPLFAAVGMISVLLLYGLAAGLLFDNGVVLNVLYPPGAVALAFAATLITRLVFEQSQQRMIRGLMARYLSPAVAQWVLRDPDRLQLGGEIRTMTVLFCDLRGFTTLSHAMEPQQLVSLLNEHMTAMTDVIFAHDGTLDKFIGDAVMAFWNAPMEQPDHARRACQAALDMIRRLRVLQAGWKQRRLPALDIGIGVNTGPMVVGNTGSSSRLAYTVLGDTVNVASRLEGLSKEYGCRLVIGEGTRAAAADAFAYRFLDLVAVKGRAEPLAVYEVVERRDLVDAVTGATLSIYHQGIELYRARQWEEAAARFQQVLSQWTEDGPARLYLRRAVALRDNPPPADWNGVYVALTK
jgi:adenylate cyclase